MQKVRFSGFDCDVRVGRYRSGQLAIQLVAADTAHNQARGVRKGEPIAKPSVCLPRQSFSEGETALKVYSENAGVLEALLEADVVQPVGVINDGVNRYPVVRVSAR